MVNKSDTVLTGNNIGVLTLINIFCEVVWFLYKDTKRECIEITHELHIVEADNNTYSLEKNVLMHAQSSK